LAVRTLRFVVTAVLLITGVFYGTSLKVLNPTWEWTKR
jgi:hypothetical protein